MRCAGKPSASELGGLRMSSSIAKVTTARTTRTTAAPSVQPISSGVLPRICAGTAFGRVRNLTTQYSRTPSTPMKTTAATARMIL